MELLSIALALRRGRLLAGVGLVGALLLGAMVGGLLPLSGSATPVAGEALARVLIDSRTPLAATTTAQGASTISQRSVLLASLVGSDQTVAAIANRSDVPPSQLAVLSPQFDPVNVYSYRPAGAFPDLAFDAAQKSAIARPFLVVLRNDTTVPIISVGAQAPDVRQANALAEATVAALESAAAGAAPRALRVQQLGGVEADTVKDPGGSHHLLGIAVAVFAFLAWCEVIVLTSTFAANQRRKNRLPNPGAA